MRMFLFESLVLPVLLYSAELWGFQERADVEKPNVWYIKWTLGVDIRTLQYIVLEETKRTKVRMVAGYRALMLNEEKVRERTE